MPREIARNNGFLPSHFDSTWDDVQHAYAEPDNLGAALAALPPSYAPGVPIDNWDEEWRDHNISHPSQSEWIARIQKRFHQPWLRAYFIGLRAEASAYLVPLDSSVQPTGTRWQTLLSLRRDIEAGAKAEPKNAFWIAQRALWEWRFARRRFFPPPKSNFAAMDLMSAYAPPPVSAPLPPPPPSPSFSSAPRALVLPGPYPLPKPVPDNEPVLRRTLDILKQASRCTYYDDGIFQAQGEVRRDRNARHPVPMENDTLYMTASGTSSFLSEVRNILWGGGNSVSISWIRPPYAPVIPTEPPVARLQPQSVLRAGAAMAHIGGLVEAAPQPSEERSRRPSYQWLDIGWNLDVAPTLNARGYFLWPRTNAGSAGFATRARKLGEKQLALQAVAIEAQVAAHDALWKKAGSRLIPSHDGYGMHYWYGANALLPSFALWSSSFCFLSGQSLLSLCSVWMFLNVWLAYGVGKPSSRLSRSGGALAFTIPPCVFGIWMLTESMPGKGKMSPFFAAGLPPSVVVAGAIVVCSALLCSAWTVARHRHELVHPDENRWQTRLLPIEVRPWVEPLMLGISGLIVCVGATWLMALIFSLGRGTAPLVASTSYVSAALFLFGYGMASGFLSFLIWLLNWRWPASPLRTITHTGLRWWKETIGVSICLLAWLYLGLALVAWPSRAQAKQMIEERWQMGDWVWLQKNLK